MRYIYEVSKHFTSGNLRGLNYQGYMRFVSRASAHAWKAGVKRNIRRGLLDYDIIGFRAVGHEDY